MKNIYRFIRQIIYFAALAKRSNYKFGEKFEVFRILLSNHVKNKLRADQELDQRIFGFKVTGYRYDTLQYLFKEIFLTNEYRFVADTATPKIIDCGANIGMAVLYFKRLYPDCTIMAFEPNPHAFKLLEKNVLQNNLTDVTLFNIGLSDTDGELDFYISENRGTLVGSFISERGGENKIVVKTKMLSSFIGDDNIDLVKIDIEGAEGQVMEDLFGSGKVDQCRQFIIEYHHRINKASSNLANFVRPFEEHGYEYNVKANFADIGGFQDILINIYKDGNVDRPLKG